jgi:hypothetical protein
MTYLSMGAVQADAVLVSSPQRCDELSAGQVRQAVAAVVRAYVRRLARPGSQVIAGEAPL